jgi:hypothetical protein
MNHTHERLQRSSRSPSKSVQRAASSEEMLLQTPKTTQGLNPSSVMHLQRTIGNHAVQRLLAQRIQRDLQGQDPKEDYDADTDSKSLMYGLTFMRGQTQGRIGKKDVKKPKTIDEYNKIIGINGVMNMSDGAVGVFKVRAALNDPKNWATYLPAADVTELATPHIQAWINLLVARKDSIGLYDIGNRKKSGPLGWFGKTYGEKKLGKSNRITKNVRDGKLLSAALINKFFDASLTLDQAQTAFSKLNQKQRLALSEWAYKGFFRRTSKLGIEFATMDQDKGGLGAMIHFNTAGNPTFESGGTENKPDGVKTMSDTDDGKNRNITVSEYRHAQKLIKAGKLDPSKINFYSEF